jgi:hypothetical protein
VVSQSCAPVAPSTVIRTAVTLHFHVLLDVRLTVKAPPPRAVRGRKVELAAFALPVLPRRRRSGFVRVASVGPRPEPAQELAVRLPEGFLTADCREGTTPAADDRIERQEELRLAGHLVPCADFSPPALVPVNRLRAGLDESFEPEPGPADRILPEVVTQEVAAPCPSVTVERVDDARFTRFQFQPQAFEFFREESLALLCGLSVRVEHHQILGVADPRRRGLLARKRPFDALLQTM